MESISRFSNIPVVETSLKTSLSIYNRVKNSNGLLNWSFETAEHTAFAVIDSFRPAVRIIETPLHKLDQIMCNSLDFVEQRVPSVYLPPQMIYWNTKEYVADHVVKPVLKRADSFKNLGNVVAQSQIVDFAADRVDGAIVACDKYVERYLPDSLDGNDETCGSPAQSSKSEVDDNTQIHAFQTLRRSKRFSKKLKRRLTQRTFAEVKALRQQGVETVHVLIYAAELIATNPKVALQKVRDLWYFLSQDEKENQSRPQNVEQLLVMLTRESARRVVHIVNYFARSASKVPRRMKCSAQELVHHFLFFTESLIKFANLERAKKATFSEASSIVSKIHNTYDDASRFTYKNFDNALVSIATVRNFLDFDVNGLNTNNELRYSSVQQVGDGNSQENIADFNMSMIANVYPFTFELLYKINCMESFITKEVVLKKSIENQIVNSITEG